MKFIIIIFSAIALGASCLLNAYLPFLLLFFLAYLWMLYRHPEIALFISLLIIINCFSMMNEDLLRLPYLFRIRDIFFLLIFIPLLIGMMRNDNNIKYVFSNPIARGICIIIALSLVQIVITKYRFPEEAFGSIIRTSRRYFYYAIFFPAMYILLDTKKLTNFIKIATGSIAVFCLLFIIQFLAGPAYKIFLWPVRIEYQVLQGFKVTRIYVDGLTSATLLFSISLMTLLFCKNFKYRLHNIAVFIITLIQTVLTFGRANIFGILAGNIFGITVARRRSRLRNILKMFFVLVVVLVFSGIIFKALMPDKDLPKAALSRVSSIYTALSQTEDTMVIRLKESRGRIALIRENLFFGVGFVHDESDLFAFARGGAESGIRTSDSGILTLLIDFGIAGVIWLLAMTFIFLKRSINLYNAAPDHFYGAVILGILAFYFGRLFSFITLADFVLYDGIVTIAMSLVLLEIIGYKVLSNKNA